MAIEAELKAHVRNPDHVRAALRNRASHGEETSVYRDTYYDRPNHCLTTDDRELRVRIIQTGEHTRALLTYKGAPVDTASRSKPEYETTIDDPDAVRTMLAEMGCVELIAFTKHCRNYRLTVNGRDVLATLVHVPEIDGTFLEVETITIEDQMRPALDMLRDLLAELGITGDDLTTEQYTDAVAAQRR